MESPTPAADAPAASQARLEALVGAHLDLVYSAALRQVRDPHLAEDVAQNVFLIAANRKREVPMERLGGWLVVVTRYVALSMLRAERRRRKHEFAAGRLQIATMKSPELPEALESNLDEAVTALRAGDREVIVLRYFQNYSVAQTAATLGINQNAASKRIARALEKLRKHLRRHGVEAGAGPLAGTLSTNAVKASPNSLASRIVRSGTSAVPRGIAANLTLGVFLMSATNKIAVVMTVTVVLLLVLAGSYAHLHREDPRAAATTRADNGPLLSSFPDGSVVELLGVNDAADSHRWWSPAGSRLSQPFVGADFAALKDPFDERRKTCQLAFRFINMTGKPESMYLEISGRPRTLSSVGLKQDSKDPSLYFGADLLHPEQLVAHKLWIEYSTLPWNKLVLDATGKVLTAEDANGAAPPEDVSSLFPPVPFSRVQNKDGKSLLDVGMEIWRDHEFTATAIAKDGSSHASANLLTGLATGGDNYKLEFDLPPDQIDRFEVSVRTFDQMAAFAEVSIQPDHRTAPTTLAMDAPSSGHFDGALYNQLFNRDFGENVRAGNIAAARDAAAALIKELRKRRERWEADKNPDVYLVDKAVPILTQVQDALKQNDLAGATALLQADSVTGQCLRDAMQRIASEK